MTSNQCRFDVESKMIGRNFNTVSVGYKTEFKTNENYKVMYFTISH